MYDHLALAGMAATIYYGNHHTMNLLEMLISLWLGILLISNLITTFITFNHEITVQNELAEIAERGRFISYFLTKQIRLAGEANCVNDQWLNQDHAIGGMELQLGECVRYHDKMQFRQIQYFIADSGRKDAMGKPITSLFMKIVGSEREELVENVKSMRVLYGITKPGMNDIVAYVPANEVIDWHLVHSVDITFIFEPLDKIWPVYAALRER